MSKTISSSFQNRPVSITHRSRYILLFILIWLTGALSPFYLPNWSLPTSFNWTKRADLPQYKKCRAPLPALLGYTPPHRDRPQILAASASLDSFLSERTSRSDIDSLSIAIVTPAGTVFERGYGVLKANETNPQKRGTVDSAAIYRIASVTKMFTVLETLILRERGVLNWDDPVSKFLPNFTYPSYGWSDFLEGTTASVSTTKAPITLRQLASHMAGIGRDYPANSLHNWPIDVPADIPIPPHEYDGFTEILLDSVATYPLIVPQYSYPVYSNAGIDLLGLSNIAANQLASSQSDKEPQTHRELLQRDIFDPLGLNSSFYHLRDRPSLIEHFAVPSAYFEFMEHDFPDGADPAGGQFSSLADLVTVMRTFLSPTAEGGVIPTHVVREWLRPLHAWTDGFQEVGAPWEIIKIGNEARLYGKGGNLPGYHSEFAMNPELSYGVIALMTGSYTDSSAIVAEAVSRFQPAFESLHIMQVAYAYGGVWHNNDSVAVITIEDGSLVLQTFVIKGVDVLALVSEGKARSGAALWSTGRLGEFRIAVGRPELNDEPMAGCEPYWISIDLGIVSRGAPVDLIYFKDGKLIYPSSGLRLVRD